MWDLNKQLKEAILEELYLVKFPSLTDEESLLMQELSRPGCFRMGARYMFNAVQDHFLAVFDKVKKEQE